VPLMLSRPTPYGRTSVNYLEVVCKPGIFSYGTFGCTQYSQHRKTRAILRSEGDPCLCTTTHPTGIAAVIGERSLWERRMTMGQIGTTSKRGANGHAFSPKAGRARQLLVAWTWELSFTVSRDAVGNLYTRRVGSVPTAASLLTWSHLDNQLLMGSLTESTMCWRGLKKAMKHVRVTRRSPVKLVCWSNEEGSRFQLGCEGFAVSTGKRQLSESLTGTAKEAS
jgi:hypothetical protein